ncbi:MAG: hypothetical protein WBV22_01915 [Anaerolineaceae bacterium]
MDIATRMRITNQVLSILWLIASMICLFGKIKNPFVNAARYLTCILGIIISIGHFVYVTLVPYDYNSGIYRNLVLVNTVAVMVALMIWAGGMNRLRRKRMTKSIPPQ